MNILVTGGAGYVGSLLVPELLKKGHNVTVIDWAIFGENWIIDKQYLKKFCFIKSDIRNQEIVEKVVKEKDIVIHLAAMSNDATSEINPELTKSINVNASKVLIDLCAKYKVKKFIFASSASVYGIKDNDDVTEELPLEPITIYAESKVEIEEYLLKTYNKFGLNYTILRPATIFGYSDRLRLDLSVNILTYQASLFKQIQVFGGKQERPNLHIKDMVRAYLAIISKDFDKTKCEIYNVSKENLTINEIADCVVETLDNETKIVIKNIVDQRSYRLCSEKVERDLNFKCIYSLKEGIKELDDYFKLNYEKDFSKKKYRNIDLVKELIKTGVISIEQN
ncbi:NAD-dependent epimerase/dehydratase family protein [Carnobacterium mobile]|uniref:NAD-dependent epimerase/dehydratase family protein n=1 Tax=Carnobacterium mobile TaxID=2750 RepID=UPI000551408B|nr:SDR family oxidoreductase [Carnobacterium mobile]